MNSLQNEMSQYNRLILYVEYANETSLILNGDEVFAYLYDKIAMDMYTKQQSFLDANIARTEAILKRIFAWFAFYLFCKLGFYILKQLFGVSRPAPIRIIINQH
jgi:hypothetical protein